MNFKYPRLPNVDSDLGATGDSQFCQFFDNQGLGLLTIEQVADALGKAPGTIRNMIARRELPFVRIGNRNMIRKASFEAWLQRKEFLPWE